MVARKFQIKLSDANQKKLATAPTLHTEAYDLYLKASSISFIDGGLGGTHPHTQKAIGILRKCIQLDPGFADAYALLSLNYSYYSSVAAQPTLWHDSALLMANKAIKLNPERVKGYIAMANVKKSFFSGS